MRASVAARLACALVASAGLLGAVPGTAQERDGQLQYQRPSDAVVRALEAPARPLAFAAPRGERVALLTRSEMPPIAELARPVLGLAGMVLDPANNGPGRGITFETLRFVDFDCAERVVALPGGMRISTPRWAPDGSALAFIAHREDRIELWTADAADGSLRLLAEPLNAGFPEPFQWLPDSSGLLVRMVPRWRGEAPVRPAVPTGPEVRETGGEAAPVATLSNLLQDAHDDALFRHYFTAQLAIVRMTGGTPEPIGKPGLYRSMDVAPGGEYILVERLKEPFSRAFSAPSFPADVMILDRRGAMVRRVHERPGEDAAPAPPGSVAPGPRALAWRADRPATLVWSETGDGGDRLFAMSAPFAGDPVAIGRVAGRYVRSYWSDADLAVVVMRTRQDGEVAVAFDPDAQGSEAIGGADLLAPGQRLLTRTNDRGREALALSAETMPLVLDPERSGMPARILTLDPATAEVRAAVALPAAESQQIAEVIDPRRGQALAWRQGADLASNLYVLDAATQDARALTRLRDPAPELAGLTAIPLRYKRADGTPLSATLYLPPGLTGEAARPLPTLLWAYPVLRDEVPEAAGEIAASRFERLLTLDGYAVLIASMPVVGAGDGRAGFVDQIVANARAAIDAGASTGWVDPGRVAVAGHSFGAGMVASLLANSDLFASGIALSGAYNRTLTPFGFQTERRTLWEAHDEYLALSPLLQADGIDEPLLLVHGMADPNSGTLPMQSERLFAALRGLGKPARLVLLPAEGHQYVARESLLHVLWEMENWLARTLR